MYTVHAQTRCQQRAISPVVVETLLSYGQQRRHHGADIYYFDKQARSRAAAALGDGFKRLEKRLNSYLVVSDDGQLITAGRRLTRLKF